jgi:hypothetical protein
MPPLRLAGNALPAGREYLPRMRRGFDAVHVVRNVGRDAFDSAFRGGGRVICGVFWADVTSIVVWG